MQSAIETWDGLSKQYNQIMIETERTAQILEDNTWPGSVQVQFYMTERHILTGY
jgi:hypothetical protein